MLLLRTGRADEGGGFITLVMQNVGQVRQARGERHSEVVYVAVLRIGSGQNGRVRCSGERNVRVGAGKSGSVLGQGVEVRGQATSRTEKSDAVGASGVEGDEDDVGVGRCGRKRMRRSFGNYARFLSEARRLGRTPSGQGQQQDPEKAKEPHKKKGV